MALKRSTHTKKPEIRPVLRHEAKGLIALYKHLGWLESDEETGTKWVADLLSGSLCCFGAFHEGRLVGFGRSISDGVSDAYIQDVAVHESFRNSGLGTGIVKAILNELQARRIKWIGLISTPGSAAFYRRLGFSTMPGHIPMRLTVS